jgi:membrane protease YdiL (CAAX protease family)
MTISMPQTQNFKSTINIKTANRAILAFALLPLLSIAFWTLPHGLGFLIFALINLMGIVVFFRKPLREFIQDERFRNIPSLPIAIALTGLVVAINLGLVIFVLGLIGYFAPNAAKILLTQAEIVGLTKTSGFNVLDIAITLLAGAVIVPFYEEFLFRGIALKAYERERSSRFAAIFTTFIFALLHASWLSLISIFASFSIVARAVQKKKSWWLGVIPHMANNGLVFGATLLSQQFGQQEQLKTSDLPTLGASCAAGAIAIIAFAIAARWLKLFTSQTLTISEKLEKIWTPSLIVVMSLMSAIMALQLLGLFTAKP